jgi:hypothetical protein
MLFGSILQPEHAAADTVIVIVPEFHEYQGRPPQKPEYYYWLATVYNWS